MRRKETDLFQPIKQWLEERDYEVYAEVQPHQGGARADIVGVCGPAVAVVELKRSLSLDLIGQVIRWKPYANYVYIGVPKSKHRNEYGERLLRREGIGLLELNEYGRIQNWTRAKFNRRVDDRIRKCLVPEHKELMGGHSGGGYVTPYRLTMDRVQAFLRRKDWVTIKEILDHCETHYSAPKPSLSQALRSFELDWCEWKKENGRLYFRMKRESIHIS